MNAYKEFEKIIFNFTQEAGERGGQTVFDKAEYGHNFHFTDKDALKYLRENASKMSQKSLDRMKGNLDTVFAGIGAGKPMKGIIEDVHKVFADFSGYEAERFARTETSRGVNNGALLGYQQMGVQVVELYNNPGACPICSAMSGDLMTVARAMGYIPVHPNCYCFWIARTEITSPKVEGWKGIANIPQSIITGLGIATPYTRVSMSPKHLTKISEKSKYHLGTPEAVGIVIENADRAFLDKNGIMHFVIENGEERPPYARVKWEKSYGMKAISGYLINRVDLVAKLEKAVKTYGY